MLEEVYPWAPLTQLGLEIFFFWIITESILGVVFIDSQGNIEECEKLRMLFKHTRVTLSYGEPQVC